jgi:sigma-B regulation protein RsbU (phosphoserine phosphatase)
MNHSNLTHLTGDGNSFMTNAKNPENLQDWLALKDRALSVAAEGITIADARLPDRPLIYVNEGFERLTGYTAAEVLGKNCKFLQGRDSDQDTVGSIREALEKGIESTVEILNRRKDGTPFWNRLSITPVRADSGELTHFIGVQSDVTKRKKAEEALREVNAQMRRDLEEAARIQQAWLPQSVPSVPGFSFAWKFRPCDELAGDGLNIIHLDEHLYGVHILDVSGHGVPAALLSVSLNRMLSPQPEQSCLFVPAPASPTGFAPADPALVAATLNRQFAAGPATGRFFTIIYGILDIRNGAFRYVTAGHPPPLLINAEGAQVCPLASGVPIGALPGFQFKERTVHLAPGDRLLLYTDGASEAFDAEDEEMGEQRLLDALVELYSLPPEDSLAEMVRRIEDWCPGGQPQDDVTLLSIDAHPR